MSSEHRVREGSDLHPEQPRVLSCCLLAGGRFGLFLRAILRAEVQSCNPCGKTFVEPALSQPEGQLDRGTDAGVICRAVAFHNGAVQPEENAAIDAARIDPFGQALERGQRLKRGETGERGGAEGFFQQVANKLGGACAGL